MTQNFTLLILQMQYKQTNIVLSHRSIWKLSNTEFYLNSEKLNLLLHELKISLLF